MISTGRHLVGRKVRVIRHASVVDGRTGIVRGFCGRTAYVALTDQSVAFTISLPVALLALVG